VRKEVMQSAEMDDKIIGLLTVDADLPYREIAKKLGSNASTVRKRILALKRRGVIRKFMVEVDEGSLGRRLNVSLAVDVDPTKFIDVARRLVAIPEIAMAFHTSGGHDIFLILWTKDSESLSAIVNSVTSIDGVVNVLPSFIIERLR
jgi:Lrp/AsnC family transcriptional regulator, regulator for asnA, asnC and gidA